MTLRALVALLLDTGLRFNEAAALRWSDVTLEGVAPAARIFRGAVRGVIGETKTARGRTVPLMPRVVNELRELPRDHELLFHAVNGRPLRVEWTLRYLHRMCDGVGIKRVGWHALRHTCATLACQRGMPLRNVQALLGHTSITMTSRYAHATDQDLQRWMRHCLTSRIGDTFGHQVVTKGLPPASVPS